MSFNEKAGMVIFTVGALAGMFSIPDYNRMAVAGIIMVVGILVFIYGDN